MRAMEGCGSGSESISQGEITFTILDGDILAMVSV